MCSGLLVVVQAPRWAVDFAAALFRVVLVVKADEIHYSSGSRSTLVSNLA